MKLTHTDIFNLFSVLQKLVKVQTDDGGRTLFRIAKNIRLLSEAGQDIEAVRKTLADKPPEEWQAFLRRPYEGELGLLTLNFAACRLEENGITPAELAALLPILEDCPE